MTEGTRANGINSAKNGCSYIVMSDRTGMNFRNSNMAGNTAKFFCKQAATGVVERYPVEVTAYYFDKDRKFVDAVYDRRDVNMCDKHIALVAKQRAKSAARAAKQAKAVKA